MSYQEFEDLPRHGRITELLDGEYFVVSPVFRHQHLVTELLWALRAYLDGNPVGTVITAPFDIVLSKPLARVIQPDSMFMTPDALARLERGARLIGLPDLAIEVLSGDGSHDRGKKLQYYAEYGIPELWHVSQERPRVEVYLPDSAGKLAKVADLGANDKLTSPLLPGFELAIIALYSAP